MTATFGGTPPPPVWNTTIVRKPPKLTRSRTATFYWIAKRNGTNVSSFKSQCKLDKKAWVSCHNGKRYTLLSRTTHTFRVRAGNNGVWDKTPGDLQLAHQEVAPARRRPTTGSRTPDAARNPA